MKIGILVRLMSGCGLALALTQPASAQQSAANESADSGGVGDIVVVARRTAESLQDVPLSVGVVQPAEIKARNIDSATGLGALVAGLSNTRTGTPGGGFTIIRGSISPALPSPGVDAGTGLYVDGVNLPRNQGVGGALIDIERIEILRGPQGTLSGRNHSSGSVSFITKAPTDQFELESLLTYGNLGRRRGNIIVNVPAGDGLALRMTYQHDEQDGNVRNTTTVPGYNVGRFGAFTPVKRFGESRNSDTFTAKVRYTGIEGFTFDYKFDYTNQQETAGAIQALAFTPTSSRQVAVFLRHAAPGAIAFGDKPSKAYAQDFLSQARVNSWGHLVTLNYDASEALSIKSISSLRYARSGVLSDNDSGEYLITPAITTAERIAGGLVDATGAPLGNGVYSFSYPSNKLRQKQFSQELQFSGTVNRLKYVAGLFYFREVADALISIPFGSTLITPLPGQLQTTGFDFLIGTDEHIRNTSKAAYAHVDYDILEDRLNLSLGGRYTIDNRHTDDNSGFSGPLSSVEYKRFNWDASLTYNFSRDINAYFRYANAYNAGGLVRGLAFKPEESDQFELGLKSELFDRRLRANFAVYQLEFSDKQIGTSNFIPGSTGPNGELLPFGLFVRNLDGKTRIRGFELELTAAPIEGLTLTSNFGYNDPRFPRGTRAGGGRQLYQAPKFNFSFSGQYDFPAFSNGSFLTVRADGDYRSKYYGVGIADGAVQGTYDPAFLAQVYPGKTSAEALADLYQKGIAGDYWLVNGRVTLNELPLDANDSGKNKLSISAYVKNIFNSRGTFFAANYGTILAGSFERQRTYGIELGFRF